MFVQLLLALEGLIPGVGVTRYLSFRLGAATLTTFLLTIILIPLVAKMARRQGFSDRDDKSDSAELNSLHAAKRSTPTPEHSYKSTTPSCSRRGRATRPTYTTHYTNACDTRTTCRS